MRPRKVQAKKVQSCGILRRPIITKYFAKVSLCIIFSNSKFFGAILTIGSSKTAGLRVKSYDQNI